MREILIALVLSLTACLITSCAPATPVLVLPALEVPARPAMLPVLWQHESKAHCLNDDNARNLLINIERLNSHIAVLEAYIKAASQ